MTTPRETPSAAASPRVDGSAAPGREPPGLDVLAQPAFELLVERKLAVVGQLDLPERSQLAL